MPAADATQALRKPAKRCAQFEKMKTILIAFLVLLTNIAFSQNMYYITITIINTKLNHQGG
ncbi:MAG: hypothetical protein GH151_02510 [Bacteroidetes bacterium]|nr:hypothetical protein [Bacteroidota bacterium]